MSGQVPEAGGAVSVLETTLLRRWSIVILGAIACSVGTGIIGLTTTIFTKPMAEDLGWQRGLINYAHAIASVAAGFGTILLGRLISRYGIRIPMLIAVTLFGTSLVLVGVMPNSSIYLFAVYVLYGLSGAAATALPWTVAIVNMFDRNRGLAIAIVASGSALGIVALPQLAGWLLANYDWRIGFISLGALTGVVSVLAVLIAPLPKQSELLALRAADGHAEGSYFMEIVRDPIAWKIIIAILALTIAIAVVHPNIAPMMADKGLSLGDVTMMISAGGMASWVARLVVGPAMDRIHAPYVAVVVMLCPLVGGPLLIYSTTLWPLVAGSMLIGVALGGEADMISFITSRYFSRRLYSQAIGIIWASWAWGIAISHVIAGAMFNAFDSYDNAILLAVFIGLIGIPAILSLGRYRETLSGH